MVLKKGPFARSKGKKPSNSRITKDPLPPLPTPPQQSISPNPPTTPTTPPQELMSSDQPTTLTPPNASESPTLSISIPPTLNPSAPNVHTQAKSRRKHKGYVYVLEATDQKTEKNNTLALEADDGSRPKRNRKEKHVMDIHHTETVKLSRSVCVTKLRKDHMDQITQIYNMLIYP